MLLRQMVATTALLTLGGWGCSKSAKNSEQYYDHGYRTPQLYDPSVIPAGPSHSLPPHNPAADAMAVTGGAIRINSTGTAYATYACESDGVTARGDQSWVFSGTLQVPLTLTVDHQTQLLTTLRIVDTQGTLLAQFDGEEMHRLRAQANKGVAVIIMGPGQFRITRDSVPPIAAVPDTDYVSISSAFASTTGLLNAPDSEAVLGILRDLATATPEYHQELLAIAQSHGTLDTVHLRLLLDAAYFTDAARARMEDAAAALMRRPDVGSQELRLLILRNLVLARSLGQYTNSILATGLRKATDLTADDAMNLMRKAFPGPGASEAFEAYLTRFDAASPSAELAVLEVAKIKGVFTVASRIATHWFQTSSDKSAGALMQLAAGFSTGAALDDLINQCTPDLRSVAAEDARALSHLLNTDTSIRRTVPVLVSRLSHLTVAQLRDIANAIITGAARDTAIIGSIRYLEVVPLGELSSLLTLLYMPDSIRVGAAAMFAKLAQPLSVATLSDASAQFWPGRLRDQALTGGVLALISARMVSIEQLPNIVAITNLITIGDARDLCLVALAGSVTGMTETGLSQLTAGASTPAKAANVLRIGRARIGH